MVLITNPKAVSKHLEIVKLDGQRFKVPSGYIIPKGYALKHPILGYLGFKDKPECPYIPRGGKMALQSILDSGGLIHYDDCVWLQDMEG